MIKDSSEFLPATKVIDSLSLDLSPKTNYKNAGLDAVRNSTVAAVILSGGQGTRLGFDGPKGVYDIGLPSHSSIFQIHIEKVQKIRLLGSVDGVQLPRIPIYIMTSDLNHHIIQEFFAKHNYFDYPVEDIIFFEQFLEPCFTLDGKMVVESLTSLAMAPDGNGGMYKALKHAGCINDMQIRGIQHLHIYGIDNIMTKPLDPLFLGICMKKEVQCGNKVVWRANKAEKVGVAAELNGRMHILEYSELPPSLAEVEDSNGKLLFGAANICNHYMSLSFLVDIILPSLSSSYHVARKKIPYYDPVTKTTIMPTEVNGVKLEMFIFDPFPLAIDWVVVEVTREDEFAPVKNEPGNAQDSPDTARALLNAQAKRWLTAAGAKLTDNPLSVYEISPLISYEGEGLERFTGVDLEPGIVG